MTYIWEVLMQARRQGLPLPELSFRVPDTPSPYLEVAWGDLNRRQVQPEPVQVNARYRFVEIFESLLDPEVEAAHPELRDAIYDILLHFLARLDLRSGLCKREYHALFIRQDVEAGKFGQRYREVLELFELEQRRFVVESMVKLYQMGPSIMLLRGILRGLYPYSMIYLDTHGRRELLIYVGKKQTAERTKQVEFLVSMFVPFDYTTYLFWDRHFGIIGVEETLEIDEFVVY